MDRPPRILVFVVRHGEREDEVMDRYKRHRLPPARRFDPALTPRGHQQAQQAWKILIHSLTLVHPPPHKVAVFASPLRRVIGTAMMISDAMSSLECPWEVIVPTNDPNQCSGVERKSSNTSSIPIVVWNSLCDCAAQIESMGGHRNAIRTGFITCAATPEQDPETFSESLMAATWQEMKHAAIQGAPNIVPTRPIQFWKADPTTSQIMPMTPELTIVDDGAATRRSLQRMGPPRSQRVYPLPLVVKDDPPIDQVVRMAIQSGCDVCIVASHREEIRELYKYRCGPQTVRKQLDYCCIGAFQVMARESANDNPTLPLEWRLHDVIPCSAMTPDIVQDMVDGRHSELSP